MVGKEISQYWWHDITGGLVLHLESDEPISTDWVTTFAIKTLSDIEITRINDSQILIEIHGGLFNAKLKSSDHNLPSKFKPSSPVLISKE